MEVDFPETIWWCVRMFSFGGKINKYIIFGYK